MVRRKMSSSRERPIEFVIEVLAKYSSLFGITPWYSFKKYNLICSNMFKCYTILLAVVITALSLSSTSMRFTLFYYNNICTLLVVENVILEIAGLGFLLVTILSSSLWNIHTWEQLFTKIQRIESSIVLYKPKLRCISTRRFIASFILGNIYLIFIFLIDFGHYDRDNHMPRYFISTIIFRYTEFITSFMIFFIGIVMKHVYEEINSLCDQIVVRKSFLETIEVAKNWYLEMFQFLQVFNRLFGWPMLLICFYSVVQVLDCLSFLKGRTQYHDNLFEQRWQATVHMLYAFEITVWLAAIMFCCDAAVDEAHKLLRKCYELERHFHLFPKEKEELHNFKNLIKDHIPRFTAASFFEIRRSTLLCLLGTITTYFIVALQFQPS